MRAMLFLLLFPSISFGQYVATGSYVEEFKPTGIYDPSYTLGEPQKVKTIDIVARNKAEAARYNPWYEVKGGGLVSTSDRHLIEDHHVSPESLIGLTQAEKDKLHGKYHGEQPHSSSKASVTAKRKVQWVPGNCPGGMCPVYR